MARHMKLGCSVAIKFHKHQEMRDHSASLLEQLSSNFVATMPAREGNVFDDHERYPDMPFALVMYGGEQSLHEFLEEQGSKPIPENHCRSVSQSTILVIGQQAAYITPTAIHSELQCVGPTLPHTLCM